MDQMFFCVRFNFPVVSAASGVLPSAGRDQRSEGTTEPEGGKTTIDPTWT